jgi:hypothetical protein
MMISDIGMSCPNILVILNNMNNNVMNNIMVKTTGIL